MHLPALLLPALTTLLLSAPGPAAAEPAPTGSATAAAADADAGGARLATALAQAQQERLAEDRAWRTMIHHVDGWFSRHGLIDSPSFYLSPRGKADAAAELEATLRGLFAPAPADAETAVAARYPLRTRWLCARLGIDRATLPVPSSPALDRTLAGLKPRAATLVFPAGYLGNPSSMFGHTLILVHGSERSPLLAQAVNYAARVDGMGVGTVLAGVVGGVSGYFSIQPYHQKVLEYADLEQRDLWEYRLDLTPEEVERIVLHCWELREAGSDYYFFDENCSFNLLFLLEVARPGVHLTDRAPLSVIPVDTLRWIRAEGLVEDVRYRPSRMAAVQAGRAALGGRARLAEDLALGATSVTAVALAVPEAGDRAQVLDLAAQILPAMGPRQDVTLQEYQVRVVEVLKARAALGAQPPLPPVPMPVPPDLGHRSGRLAAGGGRGDGGAFAAFAWRPAQHDLADPPEGQVPGGEVQFMDTEARWYDHGGFALDRVDVVRLRNLNPSDRLFHRWSWELLAGLRSERMGPDDAGGGAPDPTTQAQGVAALGQSWYLGAWGRPWLMARAEGRARLWGGAAGWGDGVSIGPGAQGGWLLSLPGVALLPEAGWTQGLLGDRGPRWDAGATLRTALGTDWALDLAAVRRHQWERDGTEAALRLMRYY